ncbi:MAG: hypothetical protein K0Q60_5052 [Microvirga sp.]|jgi:hypothetical protein|nr:hypothetical protein [Microvirga sp.]
MDTPHQLPACFFPLSTEEAAQEYDLMARALSDAGRLTLAMHRAVSSYALQVDSIVTAIKMGKPMRAFSFATLDRARSQLKLEELEKTAPPSLPALPPPPNKFANCGFASRSRAATCSRL